MPDQNQNQTDNTNPPVPPAPAATNADTAPDTTSSEEQPTGAGEDAVTTAVSDATISDVANKINDAHNILIALSSDPTVDDLSAAIGLSLCLDRTGKRTTAIYSGTTPNALEFLRPADTFEATTDTLQDFVIALNKEKADHLRYKLDGEYVKIFITPYRTRIAEEDLEFSYGDFNIDLVIALDVASGVDLDSALREHGRIMHDAAVVNITTSAPGKFGEIEWSDPEASSVSEMVARLLYTMGRKITIEKEDATALLTGIIAATDRFSDSNTTPETMQIASRLMASGADQKLITENITSDIKDELFNLSADDQKEDITSLSVDHDKDTSAELELAKEEVPAPDEAPVSEETSAPELEPKEEVSVTPTEPELPTIPPLDSLTSLPPVTDASDSLVATGSLDDANPLNSAKPDNFDAEIKTETVVSPTNDFATEVEEGTNKYGQMLEAALAELNNSEPTPTVTPEMSAPALGESIEPTPIAPPMNPAASIAPPVATSPEINGVPEINYMPLPGDEVLPPPPAPPIDFDGGLPQNDTPSAPQDGLPQVSQPAMQDQVYNPQAANPSAFKIPGT